MSRRSVNPSRRVADGGLPSFGGPFHPKSRSPPVLTIALVVLVILAFCLLPGCYCCYFEFSGCSWCICSCLQGVIFLIAYFNSSPGRLKILG
jgi:hypothetical protein